MIDINEWVQRDREKKRRLFGEIGLHYDCVNYGTLSGKPFCNACTFYTNGHQITMKSTILQCEKNICYHYAPKRKEGNND